MFRVRDSDVPFRPSATVVIVVLSLLLALVLSAAAVYQVLEEYRLLGGWLTRTDSASEAELASLRQDIGGRIIIRSAALVALLLCTLATLSLQLIVRRTLDHVKRFAHDILGSIDQGVITTDRRRVISSINTAAASLLDTGPECVGRPLAGISSGDVPLVELADRVAARGEAVWDHDFVVERGRHVRRLRADAHVLKDEADQTLGCVILLRDVSERVIMEERVRQMERFLSLGDLATGLHHEIKNPLTALALHVHLLEKRLRDPDSRRHADDVIGVLKSELLRLNGVLESFRTYANLQRLTIRPTDVHALLVEVAHLVRPQAAEQAVEVVFSRPEGALPSVSIDAEKFRQATLNLVINALEAMPDGGTLSLGASADDGALRVEVSDTGQGIPPEVQSEVFKPYFSTKCRGTGMGLALTEKLVGQHGGRIDFRTGSGGTTFHITVPLEPPVMAGSEP
jgi:two-component system sensor histidine kinase HydH